MMAFHTRDLKDGTATIGQAGRIVRALAKGQKPNMTVIKAALVKAYSQCQAHRKRIAELTNRLQWLERQLGFQGGA